ncbi:hypothetical protein KSF_077120 [Reticulibacter mediterranei]|uniref:Glyoxalase-like domain-containing protein n=1 Tax=Reticulibacter mediterranei TaxID=2778369 RepID=A0A8J3IL92_9CHLR|nr:hypothetical protein [Reticulibacter mediterranei]GHO97664.1 hypothetical protein KSF_077120 [Reticulibacter mediterranei]
MQALIHRIDHIMIRVNDATYDRVFSLFADTLQLPIAWDIHNFYPPFKAGGIMAGSINMEIFRSGEQPLYPGQAQLYGIALEPVPIVEALPELTRRGIPHLPPYAIPQAYLSNPDEYYTLIYVGELLGSDLSRLFHSERMGLGAIDSLIFDQLFRNGTVFLCEYNPTFWHIPQRREQNKIQMQAAHGGSLGLADVRDLVVGTSNLAQAREQWQRLFSPLAPINESEWQFESGPALRLIPHERDEIVAMTWRVASLERAHAFLQSKGMLGETTEYQITIAPETTYGLEIRLVE